MGRKLKSKNESLNLKLQTSNFKLGIILLLAVALAGCSEKETAVKVTGVSLNKTSVTILAGLSETLEATVTPANADNKNVTWSSSDAAVATVNATGVITAVKAGTATITVTTADGSKTATCTVTVTAFVAVTDITGTPTAIIAGTPLTLTATVAPTNATNKTVTWSVANAGTTGASISGNTLNTTAAGTATVRATVTNGATVTTNYTKEFAIMTVSSEQGVLINGVIWATRNVADFGKFAAKPEDAGMIYQWNRPKAWPVTGTVTGWDTSAQTATVWAEANDPCPAGWRVPSKEEFDKLVAAGSVWDPVKNGRIVGSGANTILLTLVGVRNGDGSPPNAIDRSCYWANSGPAAAYILFVTKDMFTSDASTSKNQGVSVRCVTK